MFTRSEGWQWKIRIRFCFVFLACCSPADSRGKLGNHSLGVSTHDNCPTLLCYHAHNGRHCLAMKGIPPATLNVTYHSLFMAVGAPRRAVVARSIYAAEFQLRCRERPQPCSPTVTGLLRFRWVLTGDYVLSPSLPPRASLAVPQVECNPLLLGAHALCIYTLAPLQYTSGVHAHILRQYPWDVSDYLTLGTRWYQNDSHASFTGGSYNSHAW